MLVLKQARAEQLSKLLDNENLEIDGFLRSDQEEVAPDFLLSFAMKKLRSSEQFLVGSTFGYCESLNCWHVWFQGFAKPG